MSSAVKKIMFVGKATTFMVGLAVILALTVGLASTALAGTGVGATFNLGKTNTVSAISKLVGSVAGPSLLLDNNSTGTGATALELQVEAGKAPMKVNSATQVSNLNADQVDGLSGNQLAAAALGSDGTKAADSDKLDGKDATAFVANDTYRAENPPTTGASFGDGVHKIDTSCLPGDRMLSGGPANIDAGTILLESFPRDTNTWTALIKNDATLDSFSVVVLCANQ